MQNQDGPSARQIMSDMPAELIAKLQADHADIEPTEWECRMWGLMMLQFTKSYEGSERSLRAGTSGGVWIETFRGWVLGDRAGNERHGLVRGPWPDGDLTKRGA